MVWLHSNGSRAESNLKDLPVRWSPERGVASTGRSGASTGRGGAFKSPQSYQLQRQLGAPELRGELKGPGLRLPQSSGPFKYRLLSGRFLFAYLGLGWSYGTQGNYWIPSLVLRKFWKPDTFSWLVAILINHNISEEDGHNLEDNVCTSWSRRHRQGFHLRAKRPKPSRYLITAFDRPRDYLHLILPLRSREANTTFWP